MAGCHDAAGRRDCRAIRVLNDQGSFPRSLDEPVDYITGNYSTVANRILSSHDARFFASYCRNYRRFFNILRTFCATR